MFKIAALLLLSLSSSASCSKPNLTADTQTDTTAVKEKAGLTLPSIISNNMVIQRQQAAPIWGKSTPNAVVKVAFRGASYTAKASADSNWKINLNAAEAGGPFTMQVSTKDTAINITNILVGDVWLCSGQSNMEFGIQTDTDGQAAIANSLDTSIRFFFVPWQTALTPQTETGKPRRPLDGKWIVCTPEALATDWAWHGFSAVGYYFAKQIRKSGKVPMGMIAGYKGGTPAQAWISEDGIKSNPDLQRFEQQHQELVTNYPDAAAKYPELKRVYDSTFNAWVKNDKQGPQPKAPAEPNGGFSGPYNNFNGIIAPITKYALKGVLWYQGESNGDRLTDAVEYNKLFPALITDWRKQWGQPNLPFLYVQLPNFQNQPTTPVQGHWPWVREAQLNALKLPNTGMAVTTDLGTADNIHPPSKKDVGMRLAIIAENQVYKTNTGVVNGPRLVSSKVNGSSIELTFDQSGLSLKPNGSSTYSGFGIAGEDGVFRWADATINGSKIIVSAKEVPTPVAVRFNWANNPVANLYNAQGLPASPFRTDNWVAK